MWQSKIRDVRRALMFVRAPNRTLFESKQAVEILLNAPR
jgi:hypothetical protein